MTPSPNTPGQQNKPQSLPPSELSKTYEPEKFEKKLYDFWKDSGCFDAQEECQPGQKPFCMVIPPPNVTGALHMGHALTNTIEDILVRWRRMHGDNTLWMPGTDHAGIATQNVVEREIGKEKAPNGKPLSRHDLGREKFLERVWEWKKQSGDRIYLQLERLGASLDWKRARFTMDEGFSYAVRKVFVDLHKEGLIYRGARMINWCTRCYTALSDLEVVPTDRKGNLWHLKYPVEGEEGRYLVVATTRPETMLGDTAVAVHPEDERYKDLHGKKIRLPLADRSIPIIVDEYVDKDFGSGAVKITPAHDFNDYEMGQRHQLEFIQVTGKDGTLLDAGGAAGKYAGLTLIEGRKKVLADLEAKGLLEKTEDYALKVGCCDRCDNVAEPLISDQWFVKIDPLAQPAIEAVRSGKIQFSPRTWEKTYFEWMNNIRDWCISRQLWWGHQIPAWYCQNESCQHITVSLETPSVCEKCQGSKLVQEEDVLDTWFSSGLWPFGTLGWPEKTQALQTFYPTAILETGFDIIFFWVARMIMMGIHFMGEVPFSKVYLHAMVRDEKGNKMSKSRGNVIDPLVVMDEKGADPLRFTFAIMAGQGRDIKLSLDRVDGYRAFCNKFWNATKFFHFQVEAGGGLPEKPEEGLQKWLEANHSRLMMTNRWILSRLHRTIAVVEKGLQDFELNVSSQALYDFTWREFCDWYIELSKPALQAGPENQSERTETLYTLHYVLDELLRLLHPFVPFVTEELWQSLPWKEARKDGLHPPIQTIMLKEYPQVQESFLDSKVETEVEALQNLIDAIRNFKGENRVSPKKEFPVYYRASNPEAEQTLLAAADRVRVLARITELKKLDGKLEGKTSVLPLARPAAELVISLEGLVDIEGEAKRLEKELTRVQGEIEKVNRKLSNESFVQRAPQAVVEQEKTRKVEFESQLKELETALRRLK